MLSAAPTQDEPRRLLALKSYEVLDTDYEVAFDNIAHLAAGVTGCPISLISFVDEDRQWFKAHIGLDARETPRQHSFCAHAILNPSEPLVVPDTLLDPRFRDNLLVIRSPNIRFYAGVPLVNPSGDALGTLCVIDHAPHALSDETLQALCQLAQTAMTTLELRRVRTLVETCLRRDALTGLANRPALFDVLDGRLAAQRRGGGVFGLLHIDLDGFQALNDIHGQTRADFVLCAAAASLTAIARPGNTVARLGGDEFAILHDGDYAQTVSMAEQARSRIERDMRLLGSSITASIGAVSFASAPASADTALILVDTLMHDAKTAGKNCTRCELFLTEDSMGKGDIKPPQIPNGQDNFSTGTLVPVANGRYCGPIASHGPVASAVPYLSAVRSFFSHGRTHLTEASPRLGNPARGHARNSVMPHSAMLLRDGSKPGPDPAPRHDALTGLLNRRGFVEALSVLRSGRHGDVLVVMLDIADLRGINRRYGFESGDMLLVQIGQRLAALGAGSVGRVGGNEFTLAAALDSEADAEGFAAGISEALRRPFGLPNGSVCSHFALGYVVADARAATSTLMQRASIALHASKTSLLRTPQRFDAQRERLARSRRLLSAQLQEAVADDRFLYHYQPQVDLVTGRLVGAEALLRWDHQSFGLRTPDVFIPVAEETRLILPIERAGFHRAMAFGMRVNTGRETPLRLSVNISPLYLTHGSIVADLSTALAQTGADAAWLTLELTETVMVESSARLMEELRALRGLGVGLSIDDFGTGHASLRYLEGFPISEIKIDRSFVQSLTTSPTKRIIVEAAVAIGRELGVDVLAEGIETTDDRAVLQDLGCTLGQGYLFGRPVDAERFLQEAAAPVR